ncbi:hypothetical protein MMC07_008532 [Pseudocyphellaria aurata]|nr:hypothetical protein [Pseudocyphellaria aurata]
MVRSDSSDSARSRHTIRKTPDSASTAPSLTPTTSHTDIASESADSTVKPSPPQRSSERLRKMPQSIKNYNENVLSGSARISTRRNRETNDSCTVSSEIIVGATVGSKEPFLGERAHILDREWSLGVLPMDDLKSSSKEREGPTRRKSTRLDAIQKAMKTVEKTKSVLGKRGRENFDIQTRNGEKRENLRPLGFVTSAIEGPVAKRARLANDSCVKSLASSSDNERILAIRPRMKHWLGQGLYVGQDRNFDPKLTEAKNRLKQSTGKRSNSRQRAFLPFPMFAGERMLNLGRNFKLPFDVFSPLPPGQPRPEEWKKTHKNVFVGDAANIWKKSKPLESSTCVCTPETGCGEDCFNRFMFYECDNSNCNIGANHCTNRSFEGLRKRCKDGGKYNIGVEVIKTFDRGHGVRSNRSFEPNQIIVEYTGEIITQDECDDRMNKRYKNSECYYLMDFDQQMILDATRGSIARFINHSCEPNCRMIKWTVAGKPRMALFAGDRGIMTGEELTYDYNFDPYSVKNVQKCRCGAPSCRGVLGPKPKETKDALKPITKVGKRKIQQALEDSIVAVTKKRTLAIPSSVKLVLATVNVQASRTSTKARMLRHSSNQTERCLRKSSSRSLQGVSRTTTGGSTENRVKKTPMITYSRRCLSAKKTFQEQGNLAQQPGRRKDNVRATATSLRKNAVRTVRLLGRGASRNGEIFDQVE